MVTANKKRETTLEDILAKVSEYQIFRYYLGKDFKIGKPISSPFHKDDNPSFSIMATSGGRLYFTDFANSEHRGTCIEFVMQLFGVNYYQAVAKVAGDFGISGQKTNLNPVLATYREPKIEKIDTFIQVKSRKFDQSELNYWKEFHISLPTLQKYNVFPVQKLWINRKAYPITNTELCFGYLIKDKWKIYWPHRAKRDKWKTNVPITWMWGMNNIPKGTNKAVITKALKDLMVLDSILPNVAAVQNESTVSITPHNITLLKENSKEVYLNFDSDTAGIVNCTFYNQFGFKWINCPLDSGVKDFADYGRKYGMKTIENYFKSKGII